MALNDHALVLPLRTFSAFLRYTAQERLGEVELRLEVHLIEFEFRVSLNQAMWVLLPRFPCKTRCPLHHALGSSINRRCSRDHETNQSPRRKPQQRTMLSLNLKPSTRSMDEADLFASAQLKVHPGPPPAPALAAQGFVPDAGASSCAAPC